MGENNDQDPECFCAICLRHVSMYTASAVVSVFHAHHIYPPSPGISKLFPHFHTFSPIMKILHRDIGDHRHLLGLCCLNGKKPRRPSPVYHYLRHIIRLHPSPPTERAEPRWRSECEKAFSLYLDALIVPPDFPFHAEFTKSFIRVAVLRHFQTLFSSEQDSEVDGITEGVRKRKGRDEESIRVEAVERLTKKKKVKRSASLQAKIDKAMEI